MQTIKSLENEEFVDLAYSLEQHHSIFNKLWRIAVPTFSDTTDKIKTTFDSISETINFEINTEFWSNLDFYQKQFTISHECLHILLYHGFRTQGLEGLELELAHVALDIVVNHALEDRFGFDRSKADPNNQFYWINTVFPNENVLKDKSFEYYFNLLKEKFKKELKQEAANKPTDQQGNSHSENNNTGEMNGQQSNQANSPLGKGNIGKYELVDDHSELQTFISSEFGNILKENVSETEQTISEFIQEETSDIESDIKSQMAGSSPGNIFKFATLKKKIKKKKWETIIKNWARRSLKENEEEQWIKRNKRLSLLPEDLLLPSYNDTEDFIKDKINVWFFQDTSGSCYHFIDRFFAAASSLPEDRFNVRMFCFDTRVYETSLKTKKLYGFGGTSFTCIDRFVNKCEAEGKEKMPDAIFIITDGYGDNVKPKNPKKWHWFLDGSDYCIDKSCNIYELKNFE